MEITIDPEFRDLLPPLSSDERVALMNSINRDGCREKISIWREQQIIIDGHNRYEICNDLDLPFETVEYSFPGRDAVKLWMIRNQLSRRNITDAMRVSLCLKLKPEIAAKAKANQGSVKSPKVDTREEIAKLAGVSGQTVSKVEKVLASGNAELITAMQSDEVSINQAHKLTREKLPTPTPETGLQKWTRMSHALFGQLTKFCDAEPDVIEQVTRDLNGLISKLQKR